MSFLLIESSSGATVGVLEPGNTQPSPEEQRYLDAMKWLLTQDPYTGQTHIQSYVDKQRAYNEAFEKKVKDFDAALQKANDDPNNTTVEMRREAYDKFVAENGRIYRAMVQAAFMDWVVVGKKEEVEYWFAVVDHDSILSRVEASKASLIITVSSTKAILILEIGSHAIEHSQHTGWQHGLPNGRAFTHQLVQSLSLPNTDPCHSILTPGLGLRCKRVWASHPQFGQ